MIASTPFLYTYSKASSECAVVIVSFNKIADHQSHRLLRRRLTKLGRGRWGCYHHVLRLAMNRSGQECERQSFRKENTTSRRQRANTKAIYKIAIHSSCFCVHLVARGTQPIIALQEKVPSTRHAEFTREYSLHIPSKQEIEERIKY